MGKRGIKPSIIPKGTRFGKLSIIGDRPEPRIPHRHRMLRWMCQCDCGDTIAVRRDHLMNGHTTSCGKGECRYGPRQVASGKPSKAKTDPALLSTKTTWQAMLHRCNSSKSPAYKDYGGRGISVCARWSVFDNFLADMGVRPAGLTLDRIDNNGNYEPSNCRWATWFQQAENRRNNVRLENGETLVSVCRREGVSTGIVNARLRTGWLLDEALTAPIRGRGKKTV